MTDLEVLKKFASDVLELSKSAQTLATMAKQANADLTAARANEAKPLNDQKLQKAANAVAGLYADRASVNTDSLMKIWGADPNTMVDSLYKVASDSISQKVVEPKMVSVRKQAAAPVERGTSGMVADIAAHRKSFDAIFGINQ